jgi:predicted phosphodiesterase
MSGTRWSEAEFKYLLKRAVEDGESIRVIVQEINQKFPGVHRTYHGAKSALLTHDVYLDELRGKSVRKREAWVNEAKLKAQARMEGSLLTPEPPVPVPPKLSEDELRKQLSEKGYKVEKLSPDKMDLKIDVSHLFSGDKMKFAVISCTQLGSKYQQITHLRSFYRYIQDQGIKVVFHCGDMVDGINVYTGQEYELFLHGEKAQGDYCVEHYPKMEDGGKTLVIAGNHDYSFMKEAGCDIVERISERRPDIEYLGAFGAFPKTDYLSIYLQHGGGGMAYARSYKMQKLIEQMAPESKPDLYFLGHWHTTCALFEYRNVTAFLMGCFQSQTPHLRRFGLYPEIGGLIMEVTINEKTRKQTLADMKFEWVPFYIPIENDY